MGFDDAIKAVFPDEEEVKQPESQPEAQATGGSFDAAVNSVFPDAPPSAPVEQPQSIPQPVQQPAQPTQLEADITQEALGSQFALEPKPFDPSLEPTPQPDIEQSDIISGLPQSPTDVSGDREPSTQATTPPLGTPEYADFVMRNREAEFAAINKAHSERPSTGTGDFEPALTRDEEFGGRIPSDVMSRAADFMAAYPASPLTRQLNEEIRKQYPDAPDEDYDVMGIWAVQRIRDQHIQEMAKDQPAGLVMRGILGMMKGTSGVLQSSLDTASRLTGSDALRGAGKSVQEGIDGMATAPLDKGWYGRVQQLVEMGSQTAGYILPSLLVSGTGALGAARAGGQNALGTAGSVVAGVSGFATGADETYEASRANGMTHQQALAVSIPAGILHAAVEKMQLDGLVKGKALKKIAGTRLQRFVSTGKQVTKKIIESSITEGIEEGVQQGIVEVASGSIESDIAGAVDRIGQSIAGGAVMGGALGGAGVISQSIAKVSAGEQLTIEESEALRTEQAEALGVEQDVAPPVTEDVAPEDQRFAVTQEGIDKGEADAEIAPQDTQEAITEGVQPEAVAQDVQEVAPETQTIQEGDVGEAIEAPETPVEAITTPEAAQVPISQEEGLKAQQEVPDVQTQAEAPAKTVLGREAQQVTPPTVDDTAVVSSVKEATPLAVARPVAGTDPDVTTDTGLTESGFNGFRRVGSATNNIATRLYESAKQKTAWAGTLFDDSFRLRRKEVGRQVVQNLDDAISKTLSMIGEIDSQAIKAAKGLNKADRKWMQAPSENGLSNFDKMIEGNLKPLNDRVKKWLDAYDFMYNRTGDEAERIGVARQAKDGKTVPFKKSEFLKRLRSYVPEARQAIRDQQGPYWDALVDSIVKLNPTIKSFAEASDALAEATTPDVRREGSLEKVRLIPIVPTYVNVNGKWKNVLDTDPYTTIMSPADFLSRRMYFIEAFDLGVEGKGKTVDQLRRQIAQEGKTGNDFDTTLRDYFKIPYGRVSAVLGLDPTGGAMQSFRALDRAIGATQTSLAAVYNPFEPLRFAWRYGGFKNLLKSYAKVISSPSSAIDKTIASGAIQRVFVEPTVRKGFVIDDVSRIGTEWATMALEKSETFFNAVVVDMMDAKIRQDWLNNGVPEAEIALLKELRLNDAEMDDAKIGVFSEQTQNKMFQNVVKVSKFMTESKFRKGKLQNIPLIKFFASYASYGIGATKATGRMFNRAHKAMGSKNPAVKRRAAGEVLGWLIASVGVGMLQQLAKRTLKGKPPKEQDEEWWNLVSNSFWEVQIFGPVQRMLDSYSYLKSGDDATDYIIGMAPKIAAILDFANALAGKDVYGDFPLDKRLKRVALRHTPAAKAAVNWYDRLMYPQVKEYNDVRARVRKFKPKEKPSGQFKINPDYYNTYIWARRGDAEEAKKAAALLFEEVKKRGDDVSKARRGLISSLSNRRPINLKDADKNAFLRSLPKHIRGDVEAIQNSYERLMNEIRGSGGKKKKKPKNILGGSVLGGGVLGKSVID